MTIFTLGHSTLTPEEFIAAARGISTIIDVRSHPSSRRQPHFNREAMAQWIPDLGGLMYEWEPALGGWRDVHVQRWTEPMLEHGVDVRAYEGEFPKQRIGAKRKPTSDRPEFTNLGLYDYSWFTTIPEFQEAVDRIGLYQWSASCHCALMCGEALWWKCHRSLIADHLYWRGLPCYHLRSRPPKHSVAFPRSTRHSVAGATGNRLERYDPQILDAWTKHYG